MLLSCMDRKHEYSLVRLRIVKLFKITIILYIQIHVHDHSNLKATRIQIILHMSLVCASSLINISRKNLIQEFFHFPST